MALKVLLARELAEEFQKQVTEATAGRAKFEKSGEYDFVQKE